jgi:hypothetical protein
VLLIITGLKMSNERILILTDDNKDKTNLVQKLKSWDYLSS